MSSNEVIISQLADVTKALRLMSGKLKMSITALVVAGGANSSLTGVGTGTTTAKDLTVGPLLRVLKAVDWELAGRTKDPRGILFQPPGSEQLLVTGADGGRLDISMVTLEDVPLLLNTMAGANGMTVTALNNKAKIGGGSLIGIAKGTTPHADLRLSGLVAMAEAATFELVIRPQFAGRREARAALSASRHG